MQTQRLSAALKAAAALLLVGCSSGGAGPVSTTPLPAPTQEGVCAADDLSTLGVLRSTDQGSTWTDAGRACMQGIGDLLPADPTGLVVDGRVVLYFVDLARLDQPIPQTIYRVTSPDGVHFDTPQPAYTQENSMVDPTVARMADGSFRLYVPSKAEGVVSAVSADGAVFTREGVVLPEVGTGMPGAILLPDGRVRLFYTAPHAAGLGSLISDDGRSFTHESGVRITQPPDYVSLNNPQPFRRADGSFILLYQQQNKTHAGRAEWQAEIHLATSADALNWTADPAVIAYGGTSCAVEMPDGTYFIYYGR